MIHRILKEISKIRLVNKSFATHRILSIDVGIRNLAFCSIITPSIIENFDLIYHKPFIIDGWNKLSIGLEKTNNKIIEETYKPTDYSFLAYQLTKSLLKNFKPQTVLIERQRYRTQAKNIVQEWIIKVNMFENMLHAIFRCFKEEKIWNNSEVDILSIDPAKVASFWHEKNNILLNKFPINYDLSINSNKKSYNVPKTSTLKSKKRKIEIVDSWLKTDSILDFKNTQITPRDFISRKKENNRLKIDDLADSLLQGISWILWERNKWILKEKLQHNISLCDFINDHI